MIPAGSARTIAGVDGCRSGWIAAILQPGAKPVAKTFRRFAGLLAALDPDAVVAVDMPIGLPDFNGPGGRGPEALLRPLLGARRSSVFSIPSRAAVHAGPGPFADADARRAAHARACRIARDTSDPPRAVSIQAFGLFPKICELDALLRADAALRGRLIESHPEAAFRRLNGERPMRFPKKHKGRSNPDGMQERQTLLAANGLPADLLGRRFPGMAEDDLLDAAVLLFTASRFAGGQAVCLPDPPCRDAFGLPIAIWV